MFPFAARLFVCVVWLKASLAPDARRTYAMSMRRALLVAFLFLTTAVPIWASESPAAAKFLRDYVGALRLTRAGDALLTTGGCDSAREQYAQARKLIEPYTARPDGIYDSEMRQTAILVMRALDARGAECTAQSPGDSAGPLPQSAVRASWALVSFDTYADGTRVGYRDLYRAIRELKQAFGPITSGPKAGQNDLEMAAATFAHFLANPPVAYHDPWAGYVAPPWRNSGH